MNRDMCGTCHEAGLLIALFVGRPLNRGLADVVLLVSFLYASVQTLAPCTALSSLQAGRSGIAFDKALRSRIRRLCFACVYDGRPPAALVR